MQKKFIETKNVLSFKEKLSKILTVHAQWARNLIRLIGLMPSQQLTLH